MREISVRIHLMLNLSLVLAAFSLFKTVFAGNVAIQEVSFQVRPTAPAISLRQDAARPLVNAGSLGYDLSPQRNLMGVVLLRGGSPLSLFSRAPLPVGDLSGAYACSEFLSENRIKTKVAAGGKRPAGLALMVDFREQEITMASESAPYPAPASCSPLFFSVESRKSKESIIYKIDAQDDLRRQRRIFTLTGG